jgi:hypothetical protein
MFPNTFEAWLAREHGPAEPTLGKCQCCGADDERLIADYCNACLHYQYGYDQAQAGVLRAVVYGAVRGALDDDIPWPLIRDAVDQAHTDYLDANAESAFRIGRESGAEAATKIVGEHLEGIEAKLAATSSSRNRHTRRRH